VSPRAEIEKARSHYEHGRYAAAIKILRREKKSNPSDPEINSLLNKSLCKAGIQYYEDKEYQKAARMLRETRKGKDCPDRDSYLNKARKIMKDMADDYYRRGLVKFREQKLDEAIKNWKKVLEYEPGHRKAKEYIEKSRKIQESLEQHK
jgi:tetratricopeptide (TPR) repeat protein